MSDINFEKFKQTWEAEIKKIENKDIDDRGSQRIFYRYQDGRMGLVNNMWENDYTNEVSAELNFLETKLKIALETARMKDKRERRNLHIKLVELFTKIVDFFSRIIGKDGK